MDCSPPGSSVHGILQARIPELGCHFLLQGIFPNHGSNPHLESQFLGRLIRSLGVPEETEVWGFRGGDRGLEFLSWRKGQTIFFLSLSLHCLVFRSDQISRSIMSNSLRPHESQHARPPCPSPTPGVHSDSRPSSQWCHPTISSSVVPLSSCPQSLPASESFPMSQLCMRWPKYWSFSFSIIPSKEIPGLVSFRMDWLDRLAVQGTVKSLLQHHSSKASILRRSAFFTLTYINSSLI